MFDAEHLSKARDRAIVVGAGIGGLATALRLQAAGLSVTIVDRNAWIGGKMRGVPSAAGLVDAGPTVLTMRKVFEDLFAATGQRLSDHVTLVRQPCLARHFWPDGSTLDLFDDPDRSADAVEAFAGSKAKRQFKRFSNQAKELFELFDAPMMRAADPQVQTLAKAVMSAPWHLPTLAPTATLAAKLGRTFSDPRLAQLFGRYATYVGGSPYKAPALLSLIWQAEAAGVWCVEGGMHHLAEVIADRFQAMGGTILLQTDVQEITVEALTVTGVALENGRRLKAPLVVFNGDPRALANGKLGPAARQVAAATKTTERSLSARVWSFAATLTEAPDLVHHNVFFCANPKAEFDALAAGLMPQDPTIYLCAEDRGEGRATPQGAERFELILNAAPLTLSQPTKDEVETCRQVTFQTLARFGLRFDPMPENAALTTPEQFEAMFPESEGSLYGQSPHGMMASLQRPRARTQICGLYLAGGGTHPGAGVPMAALSGQHAAAAILKDLVST